MGQSWVLSLIFLGSSVCLLVAVGRLDWVAVGGSCWVEQLLIEMLILWGIVPIGLPAPPDSLQYRQQAGQQTGGGGSATAEKVTPCV